ENDLRKTEHSFAPQQQNCDTALRIIERTVEYNDQRLPLERSTAATTTGTSDTFISPVAHLL
ncbi:MAG: hypothetical protein MI741_10290, partial [Rhodospirillales bacterium]|nr:hypothetical protein [Rhodospirillales bacterium]